MARRRAWEAGAAPEAGGELRIDFDATISVAHSEKQDAAATWKKTFGFHPLLAFLDRPEVAGGEALAGLLRPGNAGSNTLLSHGSSSSSLTRHSSSLSCFSSSPDIRSNRNGFSC